jgi:tetratricopeptide (TPR) repeat protein
MPDTESEHGDQDLDEAAPALTARAITSAIDGSSPTADAATLLEQWSLEQQKGDEWVYRIDDEEPPPSEPKPVWERADDREDASAAPSFFEKLKQRLRANQEGEAAPPTEASPQFPSHTAPSFSNIDFGSDETDEGVVHDAEPAASIEREQSPLAPVEAEAATAAQKGSVNETSPDPKAGEPGASGPTLTIVQSHRTLSELTSSRFVPDQKLTEAQDSSPIPPMPRKPKQSGTPTLELEPFIQSEDSGLLDPDRLSAPPDEIAANSAERLQTARAGESSASSTGEGADSNSSMQLGHRDAPQDSPPAGWPNPAPAAASDQVPQAQSEAPAQSQWQAEPKEAQERQSEAQPFAGGPTQSFISNVWNADEQPEAASKDAQPASSPPPTPYHSHYVTPPLPIPAFSPLEKLNPKLPSQSKGEIDGNSSPFDNQETGRIRIDDPRIQEALAKKQEQEKPADPLSQMLGRRAKDAVQQNAAANDEAASNKTSEGFNKPQFPPAQSSFAPPVPDAQKPQIAPGAGPQPVQGPSASWAMPHQASVPSAAVPSPQSVRPPDQPPKLPPLQPFPQTPGVPTAPLRPPTHDLPETTEPTEHPCDQATASAAPGVQPGATARPAPPATPQQQWPAAGARAPEFKETPPPQVKQSDESSDEDLSRKLPAVSDPPAKKFTFDDIPTPRVPPPKVNRQSRNFDKLVNDRPQFRRQSFEPDDARRPANPKATLAEFVQLHSKLLLSLVALAFFVMLGATLAFNLPRLSDGSGLFASPGARAERHADDLYSHGQYLEAIAYFTEALGQRKDDAGLLYKRGRAHLAVQHYQQAIDDFNDALKAKPDYVDPHLDRAAAFFYLARYGEAVKDYDAILTADPKNADALFGRGLTENKRKDYSEAVNNLQAAVTQNPKYTEAYQELGRVYDATGKLKEAVDAYTRALGLDESAETYYNRAVAYRKLGRPDDALKDYTHAISLNSGHMQFFNDRGDAYMKAGRIKEAVRDFDSAIALDSDSDKARRNIKIAGSQLLKRSAASGLPDALTDTALAYLALGDNAKATAAATRAIIRDASNSRAFAVLGRCQLENRDYNKAIANENKAIQLDQSNRDAYLYRARANLLAGQLPNAKTDYEKHISLADSEPQSEFFNTRAQAYYDLAIVDALLNEGGAAAVNAKKVIKLQGWECPQSGFAALLAWLGYSEADQGSQAGDILAQAERNLRSTVWPHPIIRFLQGELNIDELKLAAKNGAQEAQAQTWIGFQRALSGATNEARAAFTYVKENARPDSDAYILSANRLAALKSK